MGSVPFFGRNAQDPNFAAKPEGPDFYRGTVIPRSQALIRMTSRKHCGTSILWGTPLVMGLRNPLQSNRGSAVVFHPTKQVAFGFWIGGLGTIELRFLSQMSKEP